MTIEDLRVSYGRVPALHGISLSVEEGEVVALSARTAPASRRRSSAIFGLVRAARGGTISVRGPLARRRDPGADRAPRPRARAGGPPHLRDADRRREPHAGRRPRAATAPRAAQDLDATLERFPVLEAYYRTHRPAGSRAASSSSSRSPARSSAGPGCCCSTSRRSGSRRVVIDLVFDALAELRDEGVTILLVEQNAARAVEFADRCLRPPHRPRRARRHARRDLQRRSNFETDVPRGLRAP